jgi:tetratricopeptide (TPR) repeat protein
MVDDLQGLSQWQVMLSNGRVLGPFSTSIVLKMLKDQSLSGEEKIKKAGSQNSWVSFVNTTEFYETLMEMALEDRPVKNPGLMLEVLSQETVIEKPPKHLAFPKTDDFKKGESPKKEKNFDEDVTRKLQSPEKMKVFDEDVTRRLPSSKDSKDFQPQAIKIQVHQGAHNHDSDAEETQVLVLVETKLEKHSSSSQYRESSELLEKTHISQQSESSHGLQNFHSLGSQDSQGLQDFRNTSGLQDVQDFSGVPGISLSGSPNSQEFQDAFVLNLDPVETIEKELLKKSSVKAHKIKAVVLLSLSLILGTYFFEELHSPSSLESFHLLQPRYGQGQKLNPQEIQSFVDQGIGLFQKDSVNLYQEAQSFFVKVLESDTNHLQARAFLCLIYRELWPFVIQDPQDQETFSNLVKSTKALNPVGEFGLTCEVSKLLASGKVQEARGVVDHYLSESGNIENPVFISFKAEILARNLEYANAILFIDTAQKIWPSWVKLQSLRGQFELSEGRAEAALESFKATIGQNPHHKVGYLNKGLIEYQYLKDQQEAMSSLSRGLEIKSLAPKTLEAKGAYFLALILRDQRELEKAKVYIEKAYSLQPRDSEIKSLYLELGGSIGDIKLSVKQSELIHLGDQYVALGDYLAAQAEYKAAFELDSKNSIAAMKAGKCLWDLSQPHEAIEWLKKAIKATPKMLEASVLLADYYSQRFDFASALEVLAKAAQFNPNNADIFKGYGTVEYRRQNLKSALYYFNRSLKLFDHDPEVLVLLAQSYGGLSQFDEAQNHILRALEIDPTNVEAMIVYAKNLAQHKGAQSGLHYLNDQIKKFSYTIELRLALGDIYLELERYSEAERVYTQILDYNPKMKKGWIGLGLSYQAQLKYWDAGKAFVEAAVLDVFDAEPLYLLGRLYIDSNQWDKALSYFQKAVKINSFYPNLHYHSGRAALLKGDLKVALEYAFLERQKNPNVAESYLLAADVYDLNQEYQMCADEYQKAIKLRSQGVGIYVKMARCYRLAGAVDIAENMLNVAASMESGYPEIYREQGAIFESQKDYIAASVAYEKYLILSPNAKDKELVESKILEIKK